MEETSRRLLFFTLMHQGCAEYLATPCRSYMAEVTIERVSAITIRCYKEG